MELFLRHNDTINSSETIIRIFQGPDTPRLYFTCSEFNKDSGYSVNIRADDDMLQEIFRLIRTSNISPIARCEMGFDGVSYELTIRDSDGMSYASYHWWMTPEEGWHPLMKIARKIVAFSTLIMAKQISE